MFRHSPLQTVSLNSCQSLLRMKWNLFATSVTMIDSGTTVFIHPLRSLSWKSGAISRRTASTLLLECGARLSPAHPTEDILEQCPSTTDDFSCLMWFNWVCITFNLVDDAASDEVTRRVAIRRRVIEVPSFGRRRFGELIGRRSRTAETKMSRNKAGLIENLNYFLRA